MTLTKPGRLLIAIMAALLVLMTTAALFTPALLAQSDPTVEAAVNAAFTQTAQAGDAVQTQVFQQTVDAAIAATVAAQAAGAQTTPEPAASTAEPIVQEPATAAPAPIVDASQGISALRVLSGHTAAVNAVSLKGEEQVASASSDGTVRVWNLATEDDPLVLDFETGLLDVALNPAADEVIATGDDGQIYRHDVTTGEALPVSDEITVGSDGLDVDALQSQGALVVGFSEDGTQFATFDLGGYLAMWEYPDVTATLYGPFNFALVDFDGNQIAYTLPDTPDTVNVAPLDNINAVTQTFGFQAQFAEPIAFSADGTRLMILGDDGFNRVVDLATGNAISAFEYTGFGLSAFSPDGAVIADGGSDSRISLFNGETGTLLSSAARHTGTVVEVTFNAEGTLMASASEDNTAILWQVGVPGEDTIVAQAGTNDGARDDGLPAGFPPVTEAEVQVAEQVFEGGRMFWVQPVNQIWVMIVDDEGTGSWLVFEDNFDESVDLEEDPDIDPPEGQYEPVRGFGKLWRENTDLRDALGWGVTPEFGYVSSYRYVPGGEVTDDGDYIPGPGYHVLFSLNSEAFRFNENDGTWRLGE
ncbi:MAG: hypothetical protein AAFR56_18685 [Chloroflexota bacterium]